MTKRTLAFGIVFAFALTALINVACSKPEMSSASAAPAPAPAKKTLGIRPAGDEELQVDMSTVKSDELKKIYAHIDTHIDEHVENLQRWIQQPSISNSGEGIPESA